MFEHVIRYDDGITSDFVLASCSVPVNYDYTQTKYTNHKLAREQKRRKRIKKDNNHLLHIDL